MKVNNIRNNVNKGLTKWLLHHLLGRYLPNCSLYIIVILTKHFNGPSLHRDIKEHWMFLESRFLNFLSYAYNGYVTIRNLCYSSSLLTFSCTKFYFIWFFRWDQQIKRSFIFNFIIDTDRIVIECYILIY